MRAPSPTTVHLLMLVLCAIWGSTWLVIREGLDDLPPFRALAARFTVAAVVFAAIAPYLHRRERGVAPGLGLTLVMGLGIDATSYSIIYWAEQTVPSGLTAVLWAWYPLPMALIAHWALPGERLHVRAVVGLLLGSAGIALLFTKDLAGLSPAALRAGAIVMLSPVVTAVCTAVIKRRGADVSAVLLCRNGFAVAALFLLPLGWWVDRDRPGQWTGRALFSVGYLSVVGTVVAFTIYFWLLRFAAASKLALISYVTPIVALGLGWLVRGEPVLASTVAGAALVVVGVALAGRR